MDREKYNGWTNHATWVVNLWLENEEWSYRFWRNVAAEMLATAEPTEVLTKEESARFQFADFMKQHIEGEIDQILEGLDIHKNLYAGILCDLVNLSDVNWDEIAAAWMEGAKEALQEA